MRLALADVKKTITRRGGEAAVVPYLLRSGELTDALAALIGLHQACVGRERASFPVDRPAELIGDYRLARCLVAVLGEWYEWRIPAWPGPATAAEAASLAAVGITSPSQLRLALYDMVNASYGGYLPTYHRESALDAFAAQLGVARATFDTLLALDGEERATLTPLSDQPPEPPEVAARYNARAVEALLANAAEVEWLLAPRSAAGAEGLGTAVKRVCFLARNMGVSYDVAFESDANVDAVPLSRVAERPAVYAAPGDLDRAARAVRFTLFGPSALTGAPPQYGDRLARLCRALLGYRRDHATSGAAALEGGGLRGLARVYLNGRPLLFHLDDRLIKLLRPEMRDDAALTPTAESFDSSIERQLHTDFAALERAGAAHGWRLEREPEPVLVAETIMVPDFALTRGNRRVYLEVAGYWRPDYRERKVRKLAALRGAVALALAVPESARAEFAPLEAEFPIIWYREHISARALLTLLDARYNDRDDRLAALDQRTICAEVAVRGRIPVAESFALLHCYTRSEVNLALAILQRECTSNGHPAVDWLEGIGLVSPDWQANMVAAARNIVEATTGGRLPLSTFRETLNERIHGDLSDEAAESVARLAGLQVARGTIFEAEVLLEGVEPESVLGAPDTSAAPVRRTQPRGSARRKSSRATANSLTLFPSGDDASSETP